MSLTMTKSHALDPRQGAARESFSDFLVYDRRYIPRWQMSSRAFYRREDDHILVRTELKDLTLAGVCLYANGDIRVNDRLGMKISLSSDAGFQAKGTVLWKKSSPWHSYAGIVFDRLNEEIQDLILESSFVNKEVF